MSAAGTAASGGSAPPKDAKSSRLHSPPVELPSSNAQNFFEEAKITQAEENELKRKFGKFCTKSVAADTGEEEVYLTLDNFCRMLQYYECASAAHYESYFHAIDRNRDEKLDFQEFFLGCCAADPSTVHILNSFTGYERSQYIFDFYDTNRSKALEFDEFARLTADCMSLDTKTSPDQQAVKHQALEKARELGALEENGNGPVHFSCIQFKKFYEFIQNERLRGTSRLFRFYKSIIKSKAAYHNRRAQGSSVSGSGTAGASANTTSGNSARAGSTSVASTTASGATHDDVAAVGDVDSDQEDPEWLAYLLDMDAHFDPKGEEPMSNAPLVCPTGSPERPAPPPYTALPSVAPAPALRVESEAPTASDARALARKVLQTLCNHHFEGLLPPGEVAADNNAPFTATTPAQLRSLCNAAVRVLEPEEMVLTGIQPPVKIFGALHGQLLDLLSHFRWHQAPMEDLGDILYTTYVFLGDYSDRGPHSLEVLTLLLSLKVLYPHRVALLRGHHESRHLNYHLGLRSECERRLGSVEGTKVFESLNRVFEHLSLAAVIGGQLLAMGPGTLPPSLTRLEQLRRLKKPLVLPHALQPRPSQPVDRLSDQVLLELFTPSALMPREMGVVRDTSAEQVKAFCSQHRLAAIIQSRQIPSNGFAFEANGRLITISSCTNYCDLPGGNDAAILLVTKKEGSPNLHVRPKVMTARQAKIYGIVGRARPTSVPSRWPAQSRAATPGRRSSGAAPTDGDPTASANGLVVLQDRSVVADSDATSAVYPTFSFGRPPSGLAPRERDAAAAPLPTGSAAGDLQGFSSNVAGSEDWAMMTLTSGRPGPRGSLGPRRNGGSVGGAAPAEPGRSGARAPSGGASTSIAPSGASAAAVSAAGAPPPPGGPGGSTPASAPKLPLGSGSGRGAPSPTSERSGSRSGAGASAVAGAGTGGVRVSSAGRTGSGSVKGKEEGRGASQGPVSSPKAGPAAAPGQRGPRPLGSDAALGDAGSASPRGKDSAAATPGEGDAAVPTDRESLGRLLKASPPIVAALLPASPAAFLQTPQASEQPLIAYLCRLWIEAGLGDADWKQALHMFEGELSDQPRQQTKSGAFPGNGSEAVDEVQGRWTLETFSMWLLKRGRRLRECTQWFRAFDYDQDEMVGVADFLQGLVASAAPRSPEPSSCSSICTALAIFRLLDMEKRQSLEVRDLEAIFNDAQVQLSGLDLGAPLAQVSQRATDFDFFCATLLPPLQGVPSFRLRVFGPVPPDAT